jgi:hypothetical protein
VPEYGGELDVTTTAFRDGRPTLTPPAQIFTLGSMKSPLSFIALFLFGTSAFANPIADNPAFKNAVGKWTGEGELTSADGNKIPVKETWTAELTETGNFVISGKRLFDQAEHEFSWEFFANGDLIEGQMKMSDPALDVRFEAQAIAETRTVTMKIPLTGGGGIMTIVNTLSEDGKSMEGSVEIVDTGGKITTSGKMTHRRE